MSHDRSIQDKTEDYDEEDDDMYNDTPFEQISSECKKLVLQVKRELYNSIIFGPELNSKEAQSNELLLTYLKKMMKLYQICMTVQDQTITEDKLESKLIIFPLQTRPMISELVHWMIIFFHKNQYVDTLPYIDYLDIHFLKHPLLQK